MRSHSWLVILMVASVTTISYGDTKLPLANDPLYNKMPVSTTEYKHIFDHDEDIKDNDQNIPMAENPKFNKMLPNKHIEAAKVETEPTPKLTTLGIKKLDTPMKDLKLQKQNQKDLNTIQGNEIADDVKNSKIAKSDDDEYYDYNDYYENGDDIISVKPNDTETETITQSQNKVSTPVKQNSQVNTKPVDKLKLVGTVNKDLKNNTSKVVDILNTTEEDSSYDDEDDDDDVDSDDSDDDDDDSTEESLENSTNLKAPCPRDCVCQRNLNNYLVATCNRLDAGIQVFNSDITDLEVSGVTQKFPIVLGARFFQNIGLSHVSSIKIVDSIIANVHPSAFEGLDELYSVNLTNSGINTLHPDTFSNNKKLRILTLAGNDLHGMQQSISPFVDYMLKIPSVEELDLSGCNLKQMLPTAFNQMDNIVYINLANNELKTLPSGIFDKVDTIEELDLSYNKISGLPKNIFNGTALAILNLKYNEISSKLDFGIHDIQKLDLSYNKITSITNTMFVKMDGLINLSLKGNSIKRIHQGSLYPLKSLRDIDLSFNNLEQISSQAFLGNCELDVIRLNDNNGLRKLPLEGFECESGAFNVYNFDVSNCDISELGDNTFFTMPKITTLNLSWNNIENLGKGIFSYLNKLVDLDLSNNLLTELNNLTFLHNRNLRKINLAGNSLEKFSPEIFLPTKELTELDISNCDLVELWPKRESDTWPSSIFKNLKLLNISNNEIEHVRQSHFHAMDHLLVLDLSNNRLHCDEGFKTLMKWLTSRKIRTGSSHIGFNAELKDYGVIEEKQVDSWERFENVTCSKSTQEYTIVDDTPAPRIVKISDNKALNPKNKAGNQKTAQTDDQIIDDSDDDDDSSDDDSDDDDEDDDEYDNSSDSSDSDSEEEIELPSGKEVKHEDNILAEEISVIRNRIIDLEDQVVDDRHSRIFYGQYRYLFPILIVVFSILALMLLVAKLVSLLMHRRGERYRQALLASKNSIIYQKLSEDIYGPTTPKLHRYAPINQV